MSLVLDTFGLLILSNGSNFSIKQSNLATRLLVGIINWIHFLIFPVCLYWRLDPFLCRFSQDIKEEVVSDEWIHSFTTTVKVGVMCYVVCNDCKLQIAQRTIFRVVKHALRFMLFLNCIFIRALNLKRWVFVGPCWLAVTSLHQVGCDLSKPRGKCTSKMDDMIIFPWVELQISLWKT